MQLSGPFDDPPVKFGVQLVKLVLYTFAFDGVADGTGQELSIHSPLEEIILRSLGYTPYGRVLIVQRGDNDNGYGRGPCLCPAERLEPLTVRK